MKALRKRAETLLDEHGKAARASFADFPWAHVDVILQCRQEAKNCNYGFGGLMQPAKFVAFGILLLMFSAGVTAWVAVGGRIAAVPIVARATAWLDGGYNVPSDAAVDELMAMAARRKAAGVRDRDELMRGTNMSYREHYESTLAPLAVSEAAIDAVPDAAASS